MKQAFSLAIVLLGFLAACDPIEAATSPTAVPTASAQTDETAVTLPALDAAEIELGETVYAANCASCHGVNLEGEADWKIQNEDQSFRSPPHDETGHTWHHPDDQLIEAIELGGTRFEGLNIGGTSAMPAFGEILTEGEITAVLTYIKSNWPDDIRAIQWQMSVQSKE